jgi:hypothetical protein
MPGLPNQEPILKRLKYEHYPLHLWPMITQMMVQPSSWVDSGVTLRKVRGQSLFKFTDSLQTRLDALAERQKTDKLTETEQAELACILELDRIFTLLNAKIIAES